MKNYFRRWAALFLAVAMSFTLLSVPALATGDESAPDASTGTSETLTLDVPSLAAYSNGTCVVLFWEQVEGAESYELQRKSDSGWKTLATVPADSDWMEYTDKKANKNGTVYKYRIRAVSGEVKSKYASFSTCFLSSIKTKSLTNVSGKKMKVTWSKNAKADRYAITYYIKGKPETMKLVTASKKSTSKTISGLKKGKTYCVFVNAQKKVNGTYFNSAGTTKTVKITK